MSDEHWVSSGLDDETARRPTIPGFLEVAPAHYKRVDDCSADELAAEAESRMMQAKALLEDAPHLLEMAEQRRRSDPY